MHFVPRTKHGFSNIRLYYCRKILINMKKFYIQLCLLMAFALFNLQSFATEVYKYKTAGQGPNMFKQYSMCRNNSNDGFVYAGTTKNSFNEDIIHIVSTNNSFATNWSFGYSEVNGHTLNCTKIAPRGNSLGYWVSGYFGEGTSSSDPHYPYIMKIRNNGNVVLHSIGNFQPGVFLDVEPTRDGGCIAVGFESSTINETENNSGRRGLIVKFDSSLNIVWSREYTSVYAQTNPYNQFFEIAENVTVINSASTGYKDEYFIMGSVSGAGSSATVPYASYVYLNNTGGANYAHTCISYGNASDAVYDSTDNSIYYSAKKDAGIADQYGVFGKIDVTTGNVIYQKNMEGASEYPFAHILYPYKIVLENDYFWLMGYVKNYVYNHTSTQCPNIMIPFIAKFDKNTTTNVVFGINHTDTIHTRGYPTEESGFLYSYDNTSITFSKYYTPVYFPEMGCSYYDNSNTFRLGMCGYYNNTSPVIFKLQLFSTEIGQCDYLSRSVSIANETIFNIEIVLDPYNYTAKTLTIHKNTITLDDDGC